MNASRKTIAPIGQYLHGCPLREGMFSTAFSRLLALAPIPYKRRFVKFQSLHLAVQVGCLLQGRLAAAHALRRLRMCRFQLPLLRCQRLLLRLWEPCKAG